MKTTKVTPLFRYVLALLISAGGSGLIVWGQSPQTVGTWAPTGAISDSRTGAASAVLADGRTLIAGGAVAGTPTASIAIYNPADNSFAAAGQMSAARVGHTATVLEDGRVLFAGGAVGGVVTADLEVLNLADGSSVMVGTMSSARAGHGAARLADGTVLLVGGSDGTAALASSEVFDPATGATTAAGALSVARSGTTATTLIDGRVLVAGGFNGTVDVASAEIFNPFVQTFDLVPTALDRARSGHSAALLPHNNAVLIAGGTSDGVAVAAADLFLPAQFPDPYSYGVGAFAPTGAMSAARANAVSGPAAEGYAFAAGGGSADGEQYRFATIKTDKDDYAPGEQAIITGSGWQPNEIVTLLFQEDPAMHPDYELEVQADINGNIDWRQWAPEEHDLNVRFYLLATDSRSRAQTTFTDSRLNTLTVSAQSPNPVTAGNSASYTVTVGFNGNAANCTVDLTTSGLPTGATGLFPTSTATGSGVVNINRTLNVTTTGSTAGGSHSFTVSASTRTGCQNHPTTLTANATLVVAGNVNTTTAVLSSNNPSTYGDSVTFSATVTPASGSTAPTGSVQFKIDGVNFGTPVTLSASGSNGVATSGSISTLNVPDSPHLVTAEYVPTGNFNASSGSVNQAVTPSPVTATAGSGSATYDGSTKSPSVCAVTGPYTGDLSCANDPASVGPNAGTYPIAPVVSGTGLTNFAITPVNGSYTINKAPTTTVVTCPVSVTYNGTAQEPCTAAVTGAGGLSESVPVTYTNNVNAGTATASATYAESANHLGSSDSKTFEILKAPVTATAGSGSATYDGSTKSPSVCAVTGPYTGDLSCANDPASVGPNAGTYPIAPVVSGTGLTNFAITPVNGSYTINKAPTTTVVTCPVSVTYNGTAQEPCTAAVTGAGGLSESVPVTYTNNVNAGTATASATYAESANHLGSSDSKTFEILKAPVTATAGGGSATYDGSAKSPSACEVTGPYTGDLTCANDPASVGPNAGTYPIAPVVSGTGLTNFEVTSVNGSYTISKAPTTTVVTCPVSVTYNGTAQEPCTAAVTGAGGLSESVPVTYTNNVNAGTATASATYAESANHLGSSDSKTFEILRAPVTATAGGGSATYDGSAKSPSLCQMSGPYTGDLTCANDPASVGPNAGTYPIAPVVSGTGLTNFEVTSVNGSYTISKAPTTTVVTCPVSVTYNGTAQEPCTATVTGAGGLNEPVAVTYTNNVNAGTASAAATYAESANHLGSSDSKTFEILRAPVTATAGGGSATYDGSAKSPSLCQMSGPYTGDLTCANDPASVGPNAGTYPIAPVVSGTGLTNFEVTSVNGSYTISKAPTTTVVTCPVSVTYNGTAQEPCTAAVTGAGGLSQSVPVSHTDNVNAGTATASATYAESTNHLGSSDSKTFEILKAPVTATAGGGSAIYNNSPKTPSACAVTGSYTGDLTCANNPATVGPNAGTYPIAPVVSGTGLSNFAITSVNGSYTINKAPLTMTASSHTITFNDPVPVVAPIYVGFAPGDDASDLTPPPTCSTTYTVGSLIGSYPSSCTGAGSGNYTFTYVPGTVTVLTACSVFNGFLPPVGGRVEAGTGGSYADPVRAFKLNSTIPVKFNATCFGAPLVNGVHTLQATKYTSSTTSDTAIDATPTDAATTGNQFRLTGTEWHFNLSTKALGGGSQGIWLFRATLFDGSSYSVWVEIKK